MALTLRLYKTPETFYSGDHAILPSFVMDAFPSKFSLAAFKKTENRAAGNPLRLFAYHYGCLKPLALFFVAAGSDFLKIPITEKTWIFVDIFFGSITPVLIFLLFKRLTSVQIALLSAFIFATIPFHISLSRWPTTGEVLAFFFEILIILVLLKVLKLKKLHFLWVAGLLMGIYFNTHLQWIFIIPVVVYAGMVYSKQNFVFLRLLDSLKTYRKFSFLVFPVLSLLFLIAVSLSVTGGPLGHMLHKGGKGHIGFYFPYFAQNAFRNLGPVLGLLAILGIAIGAKDFLSFKEFGIFYALGFFYALPYWLFASPTTTQTYAYMIHGHLAFSMYAVLKVFSFLERKRVAFMYAVFMLLILSNVLTTMGSMYGYTLPKMFKNKGYHGEGNSGVKSAGYWLRKNTHVTSKVFTFAYGGGSVEPNVGVYYFKRNTVGLYDASLKGIRDLFSKEWKEIDYLVASKEESGVNQDLIFNRFFKACEIKSKGNVVLSIFSSKPLKEISILDVSKYDPLFDREFGNIENLIGDEKIKGTQ